LVDISILGLSLRLIDQLFIVSSFTFYYFRFENTEIVNKKISQNNFIPLLFLKISKKMKHSSVKEILSNAKLLQVVNINFFTLQGVLVLSFPNTQLQATLDVSLLPTGSFGKNRK